jgi:hypothetical protein
MIRISGHLPEPFDLDQTPHQVKGFPVGQKIQVQQ